MLTMPVLCLFITIKQVMIAHEDSNTIHYAKASQTMHNDPISGHKLLLWGHETN